MRPSSVLYGDDRTRGTHGGQSKPPHWQVMIGDVSNVESASTVRNAVQAARCAGEQAPYLSWERAERANLSDHRPGASAFGMSRRRGNDSGERDDRAECEVLHVHDGR